MDLTLEKFREIKESIINDLKEHNNIISRICDFNIYDTITNVILLIKECLAQKGKLIFAGNGGSASQAEHISAEFIGINLQAISLTSNTSILTAIANDFGYENLFSKQLEILGNEKDILIVLSTSGNSQNILNTIRIAKMKNIKVVALTGANGGKLKDILSKNDILLNVPSDNTMRIQEIHITIWHIIFEIIKGSNETKNRFYEY